MPFLNRIGNGATNKFGFRMTQLAGKLPTPIRTWSSTSGQITYCLDNYDATYEFIYTAAGSYSANGLPNDTSGSCHGWTSVSAGGCRSANLVYRKAGWADSDPLLIEACEYTAPPPCPDCPGLGPCCPPAVCSYDEKYGYYCV